jgi:hypothetical protein
MRIAPAGERTMAQLPAEPEARIHSSRDILVTKRH